MNSQGTKMREENGRNELSWEVEENYEKSSAKIKSVSNLAETGVDYLTNTNLQPYYFTILLG
jgi:hypothetical protein